MDKLWQQGGQEEMVLEAEEWVPGMRVGLDIYKRILREWKS